MPAPDDSALVSSALRFGWYVAEVRGRNWPEGPVPHADQLPDRADHVLPLHTERTTAELRIEAQAVLHQLAVDLDVDTVPGASPPQSLTDLIDQQARALAAAPKGSADAATAWNTVAASIYTLDARVQDTLSARSEMRAAAYQLGRGLAEVYWALEPGAAAEPVSPRSWTFLLGEHRCQELSRLAGRLSAYFNPYCPPAIAGTIRLWQSVAADPDWRRGAEGHLYQQLRRWYELLVLSQDPATLIKPYQLLTNWASTLHALRALWAQLVTAAISLVLVVALVTLVVGNYSSALVQALLGVLGAVGLSAATVQARLKSTEQGLLTRLRQDAYTDLVAAAIAVAPDKPGAAHPRRVVSAEVRRRTLTPAGDATVP